MGVRVQLLSGMNGSKKNCGSGGYPREIREFKNTKVSTG
jgi:hypothetical protein